MSIQLRVDRPSATPGEPPIIVRIHPKLFEEGHAVMRFASGIPQRVIAELRQTAAAEPYKDGTVVVVGYAPPGKLRDYRANVGQRRAEAIKAAIGGDPGAAEAILQKHLAVEGLAAEGGWVARDADQWLELIFAPGEMGDQDAAKRIERFQRDAGLDVNGRPDKPTLEALVKRAAPVLARSAWAVPQRIYSATSIETQRPGGVEVWIFAERQPPDGSPFQWRSRAPFPVEMFPYKDALEGSREGGGGPTPEEQAALDAELKELGIRPMVQDPPPSEVP